MPRGMTNREHCLCVMNAIRRTGGIVPIRFLGSSAVERLSKQAGGPQFRHSLRSAPVLSFLQLSGQKIDPSAASSSNSRPQSL